MGTMSKRTGELIRLAREEAGLRQGDLGEVLGRTRQWVARLEKGETRDGNDMKIPPALLAQIAGVLNIDLYSLFRAEGVSPSVWSRYSNKVSNTGVGDAKVSTIDTTGLSHHQHKIVEDLVAELRRIPNDEKDTP